MLSISLPGMALIVFIHFSPASPVTLSPQVNVTFEHVKVVEGGRVILPCTVDLEDQSVIWVNPRKIVISLQDRRMIDDHRISVERPYIKVWNLLIRTVRYNDSGTYECRVNTTPRQIKKVKLEVQVPPSILSQLSSDKVTVIEGETATIICNVTGIPLPNVTWFRRNYRTMGGSKERIGEGGEMLLIKNISRHCDDIYECYVDNGVPPAVSKAIRVVVEFAPEVVVPKPQRIGQKLHKETILECQIYASPQGVTTWKRHGKELQKMTTDNKYHVDVIHNDMENSITLALRICDITAEDYGAYECQGSNYIGEDKDVMVLYEVKPPKTTTTTTTTSPAVIHVHPQHHQQNNNAFTNNNINSINDDHENPYSNHHGDHDDDEGLDVNDGDYRYDRVKSGDDRDRAEVLRELEKQQQIGKSDPDPSSLNSRDENRNDQTWKVFRNNENGGGGKASSSSYPSVWTISLLIVIAFVVVNKHN